MTSKRVSRLMLPVTFAIWVVYGTLAGFGRWPLAVGLGLAASVLLLALAASRHVTIKLMDWMLLAYFLLAAITTFLIPLALFRTYSSIVIWLLYAGAAWISLLMGRPFTLQYARESTPPEHWKTQVFLHANRIITIVWALAFTANLLFVAAGLDPVFNSLWIAVALPLVSMGAASAFTSIYRRRLRARG